MPTDLPHREGANAPHWEESFWPNFLALTAIGLAAVMLLALAMRAAEQAHGRPYHLGTAIQDGAALPL